MNNEWTGTVANILIRGPSQRNEGRVISTGEQTWLKNFAWVIMQQVDYM